MAGLIPFFVILAAGLFFSETFRRLHLPYVTALIVAGIVMGPSFLNIVTVSSDIEFLGTIGVVFLMFIAGSEIKLSSFKALGKDVVKMSLLNGLIPFATGFGIAHLFGYGLYTALIVGVVFVSSSIAVIVPSLEANGLIKTKLGKLIASTTVLEDIASLLLFAFLLQGFTQKANIPLGFYIPIIIVLIVGLKYVIPKLQKWYNYRKRGVDRFESELRFVFVVLIATVILFEFLGMHSIVAGFVIGLILGDSIKDKIEEKVRTVSYGIFIPTFFLIIGIETDLSVFFRNSALLLTICVVFGSILSKIASGFIGGKLSKLTNKESLLFFFFSTPQLSTTLAAAFAALEFGLLSSELITSFVVLSIVTTFISPLLVKRLASSRDIKTTD